MTKEQVIEAVDRLPEADLVVVEKAVRVAKARLRAKESQGWEAEGSDIKANPGTGEIVKR